MWKQRKNWGKFKINTQILSDSIYTKNTCIILWIIMQSPLVIIFLLTEVTESNTGCGKRLVKSYSRSLHCPVTNPKPLVFPHVAFERFVVVIQQERGLKGHQNTLNLNSISYLGPLLHKASQNHVVSIHIVGSSVCAHTCVYCEDDSVNLDQGENDKKTCTQLNKWCLGAVEGFTEERQNPNKL